MKVLDNYENLSEEIKSAVYSTYYRLFISLKSENLFLLVPTRLDNFYCYEMRPDGFRKECDSKKGEVYWPDWEEVYIPLSLIK